MIYCHPIRFRPIFQVFEGNNDRVVERVHYLASPFIARYVRVHPIDWRSRIAMRVGLLGCRQKGPCSTGFFRINNESSCGEWKQCAQIHNEKIRSPQDCFLYRICGIWSWHTCFQINLVWYTWSNCRFSSALTNPTAFRLPELCYHVCPSSVDSRLAAFWRFRNDYFVHIDVLLGQV